METENNIALPVNDKPAAGGKNSWLKKIQQYIPRRIILLLAGSLAILLFFLIPVNKTWFNEKIIGYWNDFIVQHKQLSTEQRMVKRFGTEYTYSRQIAAFFEQKGNINNVLVLIPSQAYFKKHGLVYEVPEPVTFYYFTGLKTARPHDKKSALANWYVTVKDNALHMDSVINAQSLTDTINAFSKY
jgi:hypothetical protein